MTALSHSLWVCTDAPGNERPVLLWVTSDDPSHEQIVVIARAWVDYEDAPLQTAGALRRFDAWLHWAARHFHELVSTGQAQRADAEVLARLPTCCPGA
ncbi:hypothetical protein LRS13_13820 [Svornostia abyssi]|uniref:Uncharacterized protein n=1 Tax=Svornostia abyssi TaxID=2898438 RepID=A0ABY5PB31_9ACTN|nr:hypothetical protein LRS13_13820 [Parviterribacteraceae bacterium J379]